MLSNSQIANSYDCLVKQYNIEVYRSIYIYIEVYYILHYMYTYYVLINRNCWNSMTPDKC